MSTPTAEVDILTAYQLIDSILQGQRNKIKVLLAANKNGALEEVPIKQLQGRDIKAKPAIQMLLDFETEVISAYHLTALLGEDDLLQVFLLREIPVDSQLQNGVTALHMAALSGHVTTMRLLCHEYRAFINKVDTYGWSALHYACAAGHVNAVKELMSRHCDVKLRDQDGTTAAFRADICGRYTIVDLICNQNDRKELLEIDEQAAKSKSFPTSPRNKDSNFNKILKHSMSVPTDERLKLPREKNQNASKNSIKYRNIRRVIQTTLVDSLGDGYLNPQDLRDTEAMQDPLWGIGIKTLRKILAEEFEKFKMDAIVKGLISKDSKLKDSDYVRTEDLHIRQPKCAPGGPPDPSESQDVPPLPPRNYAAAPEGATASVPKEQKPEDTEGAGLIFKYIFVQIAPVLAPDWKCLARKLGMGSKIIEIENMYPGNREKQTLVVLESWRLRSGRNADVDDLTRALRSVGLFTVVETLEKVSQEITA